MIKSPCVNLCRLDEKNVCIGCKRTVDEIAKWGSSPDQEKIKILRELKNR